MQSNNNVSSFLLLILIGLAIYLLLNREGFTSKLKENFTKVLPRESFDDISSQPIFSHENVFSQSPNNSNEVYQSEEPNYQSEEPVYQSEEPNYQSEEPVYQSEEQYDYQSEEPVYQSEEPVYQSEEPDYQSVQQPVYQSVQQPVYQSVQQPIYQSVQQPIYQSVQQPVQINTSIFNFEPNDESIFDYNGSNINDAFAPPIPSGTNTDSIDFKKQNTDTYNAKDFLPHEINDEWFETDFSLAKYQLNDDKLINTERYIIGINTVGESLKNASYDIRGTVPNPKFVVSPWNNSTYEPDFNLKPLC